VPAGGPHVRTAEIKVPLTNPHASSGDFPGRRGGGGGIQSNPSLVLALALVPVLVRARGAGARGRGGAGGGGRGGVGVGLYPAGRPSGARQRRWLEVDREYYATVHGFDPGRDRERLGRRSRDFKYEAFFPLAGSPGVEVGARVLSIAGDAYNEIAFRHGDDEAVVTCTHTVVKMSTGWDEALGYAEDGMLLGMRAAEDDRAWMVPVELSPEEHFGALKSYVAGIAEWGIEALLDATYRAGDWVDLPFGFNSQMQAQVMLALLEVVPAVARYRLADYLGGLAADYPGWFPARAGLLARRFHLHLLLEDPRTRAIVEEIFPGRVVRAYQYRAANLASARRLAERVPALGRAARASRWLSMFSLGVVLPLLGTLPRSAWEFSSFLLLAWSLYFHKIETHVETKIRWIKATLDDALGVM